MSSKLIVIGAGRLYVAASEDFTTPIKDLSAAVAATKPTGTAPSVTPPKVLPLGETDGGTSFSYKPIKKEFFRDQRRGPAAKKRTGFEGGLSTTLGDWSLRSLQVACGGGDIETNTDGSKTFTPPEEDLTIAVLWLADDEEEFLFLPMTDVSSELKYQREKEDDVTLPVTFDLLEKVGVKPFYHGIKGDGALDAPIFPAA